MDHEPAQERGKNQSPASPDSSNGFSPQLIEELFRLNQGKQGSITPHVQKEGRCFDSALCRCLTRKGWQSLEEKNSTTGLPLEAFTFNVTVSTFCGNGT